MGPVPSTRHSLSPDVDFPPVNIKDWQGSGHLLSLGELIGGVRSLVSKKVSADMACEQVAGLAVQHWIDRNVYPLCSTTVKARLVKDYSEFLQVRKLIMKGSYTQATTDRYKVLKDCRDLVYDIYSLHAQHPFAKKRKKELEELLDIRMGPDEYLYVESQLSTDIERKDPRKILCFPKKVDIDPVWKEQQRKKELSTQYPNQDEGP